jgi:hypothetical protein
MPAFVPKRLEPVAFALLLSSMMSLMVSGLSTALAVGVHAGFAIIWLKAWLPSWSIAFPTALFAAPAVRRLLGRIVISG